MPIYEYACHTCEKFIEVIVRRVSDDFEAVCPECGGKRLTRMISSFQFHLSFKSQIDQLDPKYDKMINASNPDLSFANMVKRYKLDTPMMTPEKRKKMRDQGEPKFIPEEAARPQKKME